MEKNKDNRGGILCDDMGLGKTIQALALIVSRPAKSDSRKHKSRLKRSRATLIVAPVAIIRQWETEIMQRTNPQLKVLVYHGLRRTSLAEDIIDHDVVITGYSTVGADFDPERRGGGPLDDIYFHRIILDEAHFIKNFKTRTAQSCFRLHGRYRWCLTATPVQNSIRDLYPLVHFLQIEPYCNQSLFDIVIGKPLSKKKAVLDSFDKEAITEAQALVKQISLRRTKNSKIDGKCIVSLPKQSIQMIHAEFTTYERNIYNYISKSAMTDHAKRDYIRVNMRSLQEGGYDEDTKKKAYKKIKQIATLKSRMHAPFETLLKLRLACLHPTFLHDTASNTLGITNFRVEKGSQPEKIAEKLWNSAQKKQILCHNCKLFRFEPQWIIKCGHILCHKCFGKAVRTEDYKDKSNKTCPLCKNILYFAFPIPLENTIEEARKRHNMPMEPITSKTVPSTKVNAMLDILAEARSVSDNKDKTIIFSQFTKYLSVIERYLTQANYRFLRLDGSLSLKAREEVLYQFNQDPNITVLLASTKCASVGLNLVVANRVIMMDVWWNHAVESQAIDRVYRIGQTKDVFIYRIFIKNTIEDSMLNMQYEKQRLIAKTLNDEQVETIANTFQKLSLD
ncbi:SNF2 family N-terminal domain-containing protein [Fennellomyces sp. T-0311]|nr:SNF2 family N-terminal domain-containing protein [Fennellomyces sp. T-0311]